MNIKEIAQLAGVSPSTVSKIFNQKDNSISNETRERVLKIVKEYNYAPYASAASAQKTWTLGILLRSSVSFDTTLDGIIQTAQKLGYTTIVCNSCSDIEQELKNITALCRNNVNGILWEPVCGDSLRYASHLREKNIPFLTVGPDGGAAALHLPYEKFGYQLTRELLSLKHRNIACLLAEGRRAAAFLSGYKKCLFDNHIVLDEELIYTELNDSLVYKINTHRISGVISSHHQKALEFYAFMNTLHYRIPEDVSLISLKNDKTDAPALPDISTYTVSNTSFGAFLCKKIIEKIEKSNTLTPVFSQKFQLDSSATIGIPFNLTSKKITVVGSINMDTYLNVAQFPDTSKTVSTSTFSIYPGGKGINQAVGAAKLGHRVALIGNVGSDLDSDEIYKILQQYEVDTAGVKRCLNVNTGKAYIFVEPHGASMISILAGANDSLSPEDIREKEHLFENTGYCLLQSEVPLDTIAETCKIARRCHAKTILKPSARSRLPKALLSEIDILVPNHDELTELCPDHSSIESAAAYLLSCGVGTVIVTLGADGCYVRTPEWEERFHAASFTPVDNTGASDAFISALASYLLYGYELKKAIQIASYAAGFCISREGVTPALIDKVSLETYIHQIAPCLL